MRVKTVRTCRVMIAKNDDGKDYGNRVYLKHDDGYISMYAHLQSIEVVGGQILLDGEEFGDIGASGYCPSGAHLHFSLFAPDADKLYASETIDPTDYLIKNGYPCDTIITNPYGSQYCNPKLKGHEGIDFSSWRLK